MDFLENPWIWLFFAILSFGICTFLPIWIKDDLLRKMAYWVILIPISLVIIFYVYPYGLEVFRQLALT